MMLNPSIPLRLVVFVMAAELAFAQSAAPPDVMILIDGEKLIGHLRSASDSKVVFASDIAGEVTIPWAKVQELHSSAKFAAIPKSVTLRKTADLAATPQGTVDMSAQKIEVTAVSATPQIIPVANLATLVPEAVFQRGYHGQDFFHGWQGAAGAGLALTRSTTDTRTLNLFVNLSRNGPPDEWLVPRNKTAIDFNLFSGKTSSYGVVSSNFTIYQANAVREYYLSKKWFLFTGANWDHNSNQGLDLMQAYGGGAGLVFFKTDRTEWSARAGLGYVHQGFSDPTLNKNIIGSRFNQTFTHNFPRGISFNETAGIRPAWNHSNAYVMGYVASLTVPMYKRFNISLNSFDNYINNPPPYFKRNSLQMSVNLNYVVK